MINSFQLPAVKGKVDDLLVLIISGDFDVFVRSNFKLSAIESFTCLCVEY